MADDIKQGRPRGKRYYEVFVCHGCQSCWEMQEGGSVVEHPHNLSAVDVTDKVEAALKAMEAAK